MPSSSVPDVSASHSRKQTALEVTIQVIDTTKDLVPSELVKGLLSVMSGILTMLQVRTLCGHSLFSLWLTHLFRNRP